MAQVKSTQEEPDFQNIHLEVTIENRHEFEFLIELFNHTATEPFREKLETHLENEGLNFHRGEQVSRAIFDQLYKHRH